MKKIWLYGQNDPSEWMFLQDTREKTVLGGFAAVGGFWTSVNGIFAFIFGSSLLFVAFGRSASVQLCAIIPADVHGQVSSHCP
jgi:hypothetical protein